MLDLTDIRVCDEAAGLSARGDLINFRPPTMWLYIYSLMILALSQPSDFLLNNSVSK